MPWCGSSIISPYVLVKSADQMGTRVLGLRLESDSNPDLVGLGLESHTVGLGLGLDSSTGGLGPDSDIGTRT